MLSLITIALLVYTTTLVTGTVEDYTSSNQLTSEISHEDFIRDEIQIRVSTIDHSEVFTGFDVVSMPVEEVDMVEFNHSIQHDQVMSELDEMIKDCAILVGKLDIATKYLN